MALIAFAFDEGHTPEQLLSRDPVLVSPADHWFSATSGAWAIEKSGAGVERRILH